MEDIAQALGVLGLFAAIMAILALGTEVVIDAAKMSLGLKKKPTAYQAMEEFGQLLPSELVALGMSQPTIAQVSQLTRSLRDLMAPAHRIGAISAQLRQGEFAGALAAADQWLGNAENQTLKDAYVTEASKALSGILDRLQLPTGIRTQADRSLAASFAALQATTAVETLLREQLPIVLSSWLNGQLEQLAQQSAEQARQPISLAYGTQISPLLKQIGLNESTSHVLREQLLATLEGAEQQHLDALHDLLQRVEKRRFEIQSPLRKLWRYLRKVEFPASLLRRWSLISTTSRLNYLSVGAFVTAVDTVVNALSGRTPPAGESLDSPRRLEPLSKKILASQLFDLENQHQDEEKSRQRVIRLISIIIGIVLAYLLQLDSIDMLVSAFPTLARVNEVVDTARVIGWINPNWLTGLIGRSVFEPGVGMNLNAGILFSGLAASAGSRYWHERLSQITAAKKAVETVSKSVEELRRSE